MDKKFRFTGLILVLVFLLGFGLTSCSDDNNDTPGGIIGAVELQLDKKILQFVSSDASNQALKVTCNVFWNAKSSSSWCKLSQEAGEGDAELTISVTKNSGMSKRTAQILFSADNAHRDTVEVVQFGQNIEYVLYVNGGRVEMDTMLLDCIVGKIDLTVMSNVDFELKPQRFNWYELVQLDAMSAYDKSHYYELRLADNTGDARYSSLLFQQQNGKFTDTIYFGQKAFTPELRMNENITMGSHFRVAEFMLTSLGVEDWEYKFVDENGGQPSWLRNFEIIKCTPFTNHAGQRYYLRGECDNNTTSEARKCRLLVSYDKDGKKVEIESEITQLPWNGRASDSLVLLNIVEKNAVPAYGINLPWNINSSVTGWERTKWLDIDGTQRINKLALSQVWLCYDLTADIGNLDQLVELSMVKNFLSGPIPKEIGYCTKLEALDLFDNYNTVLSYTPSGEASGLTSFPGEIFKGCTNLKRVDVSVNSIEAIPADINLAANLEELNFGSNDVERVEATDWRGLKKLQSLRLVYLKEYKGPFFDFIFQIPSLKSIALSRTDFDGAQLPQEGWEKLPNLEELELATCHLTGTLPRSLAECVKLWKIDFNSGDGLSNFHKNALTGELPAEYGEKLLNMVHFSVSGNELTGTIPESYVKWLDLWNRTSPNKSFGFLVVNDNKMGGSIPEAIINHDTWTGKIRDRVNSEGKTVSCAIGDLNPEKFICPQQGPGFDNCK